ncbi:hypothetical protein OYT88_12425 [Sporolactobacillus sp. CQH2019]|uniref:hypothetical protein n=1 Tax=Sporolactobacillus sp. CQH2019 TaxID=3023512 RepID=UPI002367EB7B|nr:hypothetical protein [Sporolactobacillus sp. CQH2019]MDD9149347.1 hypothetical protein [Sporolactobacillus sp. CQH2019]
MAEQSKNETKPINNEKEKKNDLTNVPEEFKPVVDMLNVRKIDKKMYGFYCDPTIIRRFDKMLKRKGFKRNRSEVISGLIESFTNFMEKR